MSEEKSFPSLIQQGKNLSSFTWRLFDYVIKGQANNIEVSDKIFEDRMSLCRSCEYFDEKQTRCKECGCFLNVKAKMMFEECPLNKWTINEEAWQEQFENIVKQVENG